MSHHMLSGARPRALAVAVTLACLTPAAMAAGRQDMHAANLAQLQSHYSSLVASKGVASMAHTRHEQLIGADAETRLVLLQRNTDHGIRNTRYQQTFRGIPVFGESIVVSEDAATGRVRTLFGRQVTGLASEISSAPSKVFKGEALAIAKRAALGSRLGAMQVQNEKSELMIYVDDAGKAHKAYVVNFFADSALAGNKPTRPFVIVDADSGKVLKQWEGLTTALIGTGPGGNQKTGQYEWGSGGIYGYLDVAQSGSTCTMNNTNVRGVNLNGSTGSSTTAYSYTCPRNTYKTINGGYSPINDAFYFGGVITNMYPAYTGYNALTFQLIMRVHYGTNYENAFWNGSNMSFGDGKNTFYPLVSADVAGHEVSHGFTEQHSNLTYSGQSGGMNEAFSDMGGEATEYYWKGTNDFLVGQEIFKGSASQALRYMCNPTQDGGSIDNAGDYTNGMDPHYSSGVYNKMFCNLAKTSGWGTPTAFKVMARANANYWTASSTYASGACGVMTAASDLGLSTADVAAAFTSVGVSTSSCGGGGGGGGGTTALTKGVAVTGQGASTGNSLNYTLVVPSGASNLTFTMSGGSGDGDLYVKFGSAPTDSSYDCRPYKSGNSESCSFASPSAGTYYVRIKAYSTFSGVSIVGDYTTGGGGGGGSTTTVNLPSVAKNSWSPQYTLAVAAGKTATIAISGGTGDADLYVRAGSAPTTSSYNCRPYKTGNSETCTFTPTSATTYYIKVRAYAAFSGVTLTYGTN
jgi:pseudolysin/vibriolysin